MRLLHELLPEVRELREHLRVAADQDAVAEAKLDGLALLDADVFLLEVVGAQAFFDLRNLGADFFADAFVFLVQLFLLYAGGPSIGLRLSATAAGILGLGLYASAYFAEIFRAGFAAVPAGQIEAAASVGMTPFDTMIRVMLPGALIAALPAIVNMLIILTKETVVLSIITVPELMYQVQTMAAETFTAFDAIFAMAIFYWLLVEAVSRLGSRVETRVTAFLAHEARA